ncbi:MAG: transcriptional regulator [Candidatus Jordarchaeum sp.]|uniref:transcriptional regulator n=1 Tax=Candidatus Jordarchaeum sp. TaxID=2823881 RepID=UPI004049F325
MSIPCEIAVKCVLPVVRAMTAKELVTKHQLKQVEVAKLLRISQPAISLYGSKIRGKAIDLENESDVKNLIENLAASLAKGELSHRDFVLRFCEICRTIRAKGLMCKLHKAFDPSIDIEKCGLCSLISDDRCIKQKL